MRSRYSAYVLNNAQYIYRTWDKDSRPPLQVLQQASEQQFVGLEILSRTQGTEKDTSGTVEFIASYTLSDTDNSISHHSPNNVQSDKAVHKHHENSFFKRQGKHWKYVNELSKCDFDNNKASDKDKAE